MRWTKQQAADYFNYPFMQPGEMLRIVNVRVPFECGVIAIINSHLIRNYHGLTKLLSSNSLVESRIARYHEMMPAQAD